MCKKLTNVSRHHIHTLTAVYIHFFVNYSQTADAISDFVSTVSSNNVMSSPDGRSNSKVQWVANGLGIAGISAIAASFSADWLPTF